MKCKPYKNNTYGHLKYSIKHEHLIMIYSAGWYDYSKKKNSYEICNWKFALTREENISKRKRVKNYIIYMTFVNYKAGEICHCLA